MIEEFGAVVGGEHYLAALLILILSCILTSRSILSERVNQGSFWITLFVCTLLIIQDVLENVAQLDPARRDLRMITSIAGYTLRPAAVLGTSAFSLPELFPKRGGLLKISGFVDFWLAPLLWFWYDHLVRKSGSEVGQGKQVAVCRCQAMEKK